MSLVHRFLVGLSVTKMPTWAVKLVMSSVANVMSSLNMIEHTVFLFYLFFFCWQLLYINAAKMIHAYKNRVCYLKLMVFV